MEDDWAGVWDMCGSFWDSFGDLLGKVLGKVFRSTEPIRNLYETYKTLLRQIKIKVSVQGGVGLQISQQLYEKSKNTDMK